MPRRRKKKIAEKFAPLDAVPEKSPTPPPSSASDSDPGDDHSDRSCHSEDSDVSSFAGSSLRCSTATSSAASSFGGDSWDDDGSFFTPVAPEDRLIGRYVIDKCLEQGGFASVFRVTKCKGSNAPKQLAMKVYSTDSESNVAREVEVLRALAGKSPHVLSASDLHSFVASTTQERHYYFTMPLFPTDLSSLLNTEMGGSDSSAATSASSNFAGTSAGSNGPILTGHEPSELALVADRVLAPAGVRQILLQVLDGLEAVHAAGYVHADLKPENVLVDYADVFDPEDPEQVDLSKLKVCLCDLGSAYKLSQKRHDPYGHTLCFAAPEVVTNDGRLIGTPVDVFSYGAFYVEVLTEQTLFVNMRDQILHLAEVMQMDSTGKVPPELTESREFFTRHGQLRHNAARRAAHLQPWHANMNLTKKQRQFVERCCRVDPAARCTLPEIRAILDSLHP